MSAGFLPKRPRGIVASGPVVTLLRPSRVLKSFTDEVRCSKMRGKAIAQYFVTMIDADSFRQQRYTTPLTHNTPPLFFIATIPSNGTPRV